MKLNSLDITNFLSYRAATEHFDSNLVTLTGANGSGKSSFLESIVWGLYGKTQRNSLDKHIPNILDPNKANVTISFDGLSIFRQKNPSYLTYTLDGKVVREKTNSDTQDSFEKLINLKYKTFLATAYYDDALRSPFLDLSAEERRNIICDYFDLTPFLTLKKKFKEKLDERSDMLKAINLLSSTNKLIDRTFTKKRKLLSEEAKYLDFWYKVLGDNYILKNLLAPLFVKLTDEINNFLKLLFNEQIFCSIQADYDVFLRIDQKELSPKSLSLSQKKRLNLAIMLALGKVLDDMNPPKLKLRIFDEFTSIDVETRKLFKRLLEKLAEEYQVFVVTHDLDLFNELSGTKLRTSMHEKVTLLERVV